MLKYNKFFEKLSKYKLKYMAFDWDDNILFMSTKIHMQKNVNGKWIDKDVSTEVFAQIRKSKNWRIKDNEPDIAFSDFRDFGPRGKNAFIEDVLKALNNKRFGPSWDQFLTCLIRGNIFAIITARGHEPDTIRKAIEIIIEFHLNDDEKNEMAANLTAYHNLFYGTDHTKDFSFEYLLDHYLSNCEFIGITSKTFTRRVGEKTDSSNPERGKEIAMELFVDKIHSWGKKVDREVMIGFSDDDIGTVKHIHKYFRDELSLKYLIDYSVFDTSDPDKEPKKVEEFFKFNQFKNINEEFKKWINPTNDNYKEYPF